MIIEEGQQRLTAHVNPSRIGQEKLYEGHVDIVNNNQVICHMLRNVVRYFSVDLFSNRDSNAKR